jgi:hypothetical protein
MPVDDHGEVFADDDQVDAGVRPGASLVVDERRAPEGWSILKATTTGFPGRTAPVGLKSARW